MISLLLLVHFVMLVTSQGWWENNGRQHRFQRDAGDDNPLFGHNKLRNDVARIEKNFWCWTYQICHYEGFEFYTLFNGTEREQQSYFGAMKALLERTHGKKFSTARNSSDDSATRLESKEKLRDILSLVLNSWTKVFTQFLKTEFPEKQVSEVFMEYFTRIVDNKRLGETLKKAEEILRAWPEQFLTSAGKDFFTPVEPSTTTVAPAGNGRTPDDVPVGDDFSRRSFGYNSRNARNSFQRSYGFPSRNAYGYPSRNGYGQPLRFSEDLNEQSNGFPSRRQAHFRNQRTRRSTTKEIKTAYVREATIGKATEIMGDVMGYIFDSHPKVFLDTVNFIDGADVKFTDSSLLAFKRILNDSYGKILSKKRVPHGEIITTLREDMHNNILKLEDRYRQYWAEQQEFFAHTPTSGFARKAHKDSEEFLGVYVWIQPFEQVEEAYIRLEELNAEIDKENHNVTLNL